MFREIATPNAEPPDISAKIQKRTAPVIWVWSDCASEKTIFMYHGRPARVFLLYSAITGEPPVVRIRHAGCGSGASTGKGAGSVNRIFKFRPLAAAYPIHKTTALTTPRPINVKINCVTSVAV